MRILSNQKIICSKYVYPEIINDQDRILNDGEFVSFNNTFKQLRFNNLTNEGFIIGNKVRYISHEIDPTHKFYAQPYDYEEYTKLDLETQNQFYSLSNTNGESTPCTTAKGLWISIFSAPPRDVSFKSEKLIWCLSDLGWLLEIDVTIYVNKLLRIAPAIIVPQS